MAKNTFSSKRKQEQEVKQLTPEEQEQALKKLRGKPKSRFYGRVTVDFPHDVYDDMKNLLEQEGRTMKWYLSNLVRTDLKKKKNM